MFDEDDEIEEELGEVPALPKKKRRTGFFVLLYKDDEGNLQFREEATRVDARRFIAEEAGGPDRIVKIYKVSDSLPVKQKVTYSI